MTWEVIVSTIIGEVRCTAGMAIEGHTSLPSTLQVYKVTVYHSSSAFHHPLSSEHTHTPHTSPSGYGGSGGGVQGVSSTGGGSVGSNAWL